ncbi:MliC family protein [Mycobacterium spongiae]|uniref:DUF1311 domain-containing protein n=1 Tax=Mycobacterium spongiae TaxID=886343 RepID=A0A975JX70_9MYCO|nr:MliC family protein [Mycobacterium spongiae]QUR67350.1 DUF1311 domain-containing protein [Mycobacterium spongiae]
MKLIAILAAALTVSACASTTPQPAAGSTAPGTRASTTSLATGSSLDCTRPATAAQRLVCADSRLIDLDNRVEAAYQQALSRRGADTSALASAQRTWATTERDTCPQTADPHTCLLEAYQTRLVRLTIDDPATPTPPLVTYQCPPQDSPLTARFYNQLDPPSAVLNWKGDQQILFVQPSGSGARYGRQGVEYWEHQGEVRLKINGTTFACTTT